MHVFKQCLKNTKASIQWIVKIKMGLAAYPFNTAVTTIGRCLISFYIKGRLLLPHCKSWRWGLLWLWVHRHWQLRASFIRCPTKLQQTQLSIKHDSPLANTDKCCQMSMLPYMKYIALTCAEWCLLKEPDINDFL